MRQLIVGVLICIGCTFLSGCPGRMTHGIIHPHSEVTLPTFCLYDGGANNRNSKPLPIGRIVVYQKAKVNEDRMEWIMWEKVNPFSIRFDQNKTWVLQYTPKSSYPPSKAFSCITYGKTPPGYEERIPALPLTPERFYLGECKLLDRFIV